MGTEFHPALLDLRKLGLAAPRAWSGDPGDLSRPGPGSVAFLLGAFFLTKREVVKKNLALLHFLVAF
jgi:hypothetical protein